MQTDVVTPPEVVPEEDIRAIGVAEVADRLGVTPRTVAALIASGELKSLLIGRRRLIRLSAIRAFLASREAR